MDDVLTQHIAYGMATSYILEWAKHSPLLPFLRSETDKLNRLVSVIVAFLSTVGIQAAMQGHLSWQAGATITFQIPALSVLWGTVVHTVGQFGIQQATYRGLIKPAAVKLPDPPPLAGHA